MSLAAEHALQLLGHRNAHADTSFPLASRRGGQGVRLSHNDDVDVVAGTFQEDVAHVTAHDIALHAEMVGSSTDLVEYRLVKNLCQFIVGI